MTQGSRVAGASDSYGYVSQAHMFASQRLEVDEPLLDLLPAYDRRAFTPLGWVPDARRPVLEPTYPQGLPLLMSVFERAAGTDAVFLVVPLLGALTVWATFVLGRGIAGPAAGASAALLMASSPTFLFQLTTWPMSDIPATAWWTLSLALLVRTGAGGAAAAGVAAGAAILTRPNLVPLAVVPFMVLAWQLARDRQLNRQTMLPLLAYAPGVLAGSLTVAAFNWYWFDSPLISGYGSLGPLYSWSFAWPNVRNFATWLAETQTPLIVLAAAGPFLLRDLPEAGVRRPWAAAAIGLTLIVGASYLFYFPFPEWWNLRFILPAFPIVLVMMAVTLFSVARRLTGDVNGLAAGALIVALSAHGVSMARQRSAFDTAADRRYAQVGVYVRDRLPANAVVFGVLHSGSVRLYAGRPTIRWDWLAPDELEPVLARMIALGFDPYLVIEPDEAVTYRDRFDDIGALGRLDLPVIAERPDGRVRIFGLAGQPASPAPALIPDRPIR